MKLYNSLTHRIEEFIPLAKKGVKMYVCGITPYDTTHLGHAFTYIFFDAIIRYLKFRGYKVSYTQNVTDINDRDNDILKQAKEQNVSWQHLAKFWTDKFLKDMDDLNWVKPNNFLFASTKIPQMIKIIENLKNNGYTYEKNGGVYLDIKKKKDFGKLSHFKKEKMLEAAKEFDEDTDNPDKRNPLDITLWRSISSTQSEHIPSFDSPFGPGRPGWHLECSAMAINSLGEQIDIHGGGADLVYPHHESEIAQSEGATGKTPFAKYWLHTNIVSYKGAKMSKSLGNLVLISDLLQKYTPNAIRYVLLSHHYRKPWEFKEAELIKAEKRISQINKTLNIISREKIKSRYNNLAIKQFKDFLDDDMNTPRALKILLKPTNKEEIKRMTEVLGFKF